MMRLQLLGDPILMEQLRQVRYIILIFVLTPPCLILLPFIPNIYLPLSFVHAILLVCIPDRILMLSARAAIVESRAH